MRGRSVVTPLALMAGLLSVWVMGACDHHPDAPPEARVVVFAAASLADAFREIGTAFEAAHPGVTVEFSFAGSNTLRTQLEHGAGADVFASADRAQMDGAVASEVVDASTVRVFAQNSLALIVPRGNPAGIGGLADLARPGVRIVVADRAVPAGGYTRRMLEAAGVAPGLGPAFVERFDANTVSREQSVGAVVAKIALGEGDAGIAYASDGYGASAERIEVIRIPEGLDQRGDYLVGLITRAPDRGLGAEFVASLGSSEGTAILARRGFRAPVSGAP